MPCKSGKLNFLLSGLLSVTLIAAGILGYGYWHASTHASYHISLQMKSTHDGSRVKMPLASVIIYDAAGNQLAEGVNDKQYGYVHLLHPEAGDCHLIEQEATTSSAGRTAWQKCFATLSTWIPKWVEKVHSVDVSYQGRQFTGIPVTVSAYNSEWLMWWVPLPHVGGKPYTYYRTTINVTDGDN